MTVRIYLKCDVCGSITLLRVQVGWLDWHPISLPCGKCGTSLSGKAFFDQTKATDRYEFSNAKQVGDEVPAFYLEVSGEFVTDKLKDYSGGPFIWSPPPFFQAIDAMGVDGNTKFKDATLRFLRFSSADWLKVKRINELWLSNQHQYLSSEIHAYLQKEQFPATNSAELLRAVHQLNLIFLWSVIDHGRFNKTAQLLFKALPDMADANPSGLRALATYFAERGHLQRYEEQLLSCLDVFVDRFRYLIPAFGLRFWSKPLRGVVSSKGISTASFDDLKNFYAHLFEIAADVLPLLVAYNNLHHRGSFDTMPSIRRDVTSLEHYFEKSKGERAKFVGGSELFDFIVYGHLDNKLRNAIAHASYSYEARRQRIVYFPSGLSGKGSSQSIHLLAFAQHCWSIFFCIVDLMELVYQTRKLYFVSVKGERTVHPSVFGV